MLSNIWIKTCVVHQGVSAVLHDLCIVVLYTFTFYTFDPDQNTATHLDIALGPYCDFDHI